MGKHTPHKIPRYKTLDIIAFYNKVYDFTSRYLIFTFAGLVSVIVVFLLWLWRPIEDVVVVDPIGSAGYVQETGLFYPMHYFASASISLDADNKTDNKIYGLGGPIWRNQGMWNSIDNIVQYNGVILPRQISRSAWVPKLHQAFYSEGMVRTLLEGMGQSQVDTSLIAASMKDVTKPAIKGNLLKHFNIDCGARSLFTRTFCDLKIIDSLEQWSAYDLSGKVSEVNALYNYIQSSDNTSLHTSWCSAMIKQYRYSAVPAMTNLFGVCDESIQNEVRYIADMIVVSDEISSGTYTNTIYQNPIMNQYKLMSLYQYLMSRITSNEFVVTVDGPILASYNSYITRLVHSNTLNQPYGDIVSVFHSAYLMPWLESRASFANSEEKKITQDLSKTTSIIVSGDPAQGIHSILSGSRIRSADFLLSQGYTGDVVVNETTDPVVDTGSEPITGSEVVSPPVVVVDTGSETKTEPTGVNGLVYQVLGVEPTSVVQRGQTILVKYMYRSVGWYAAIDLSSQGATQLYFDSPISGATKITHPQVIFNSGNKELIIAIMTNYLNSNPQ